MDNLTEQELDMLSYAQARTRFDFRLAKVHLLTDLSVFEKKVMELGRNETT